MNRLSLFSNPFLLGFDRLEEMLDRVSRSSADGYPPYDVERLDDNHLRITLAVAGFQREELSIAVEGTELVIRGKQIDDQERVFLHRGIAARQFQRRFVLAEGIEVSAAALENGLLHISLARPEPATISRSIEIKAGDGKRADIKAGTATAVPRAPGRGEAA